jgi:cytoskeleton protein RodZ
LLPISVEHSMSDAGMEENGQAPVPPQHPDVGPGAQLAARRQALGWTIEQVANQLNLAPRQVQAMENDNYAALPGIVIARGFVRAYAKLLKLDPAPLLALIADKDAPSPESLELRRTLSATFTESSLPTSKPSAMGGKWLAIVLLLAVVGAGGWLAWHEGWLNGLQLPEGMTASVRQTQQTQRPAEGAPDAGTGEPMGAAEEGTQSPSPESAAPQAPEITQAPVQPPSKQQTPPSSVTPPAAPTAPASKVAPAQAPVAGTAQASATQLSAGAQKTATMSSAENLVLKMREASWIEIKREDGSAVVSRLVSAGTTESFEIGPGARLVVGNAGGVDATYRGQPLDLNASAKNNVARLKLK